MSIRLRDERGVAMIVALLVSFVVLILTTVVVAQSIHDIDSSAYDRKRLQSVNAAEAGTNYYYAYLQSTQVGAIRCDAVTQPVASGPTTASFTATPTFYELDGVTPVPCTGDTTPFSSSYYPSSVLIDSTGTAAGDVPRTVQTLIRLTPVYGGFHAAIMANSTANFQNNFDIYGNDGYDGDIYVNGSFSMANSAHVRGNVYVTNGTASMSNFSLVEGELWASGNISLTNSARVAGDAISSTGNISGSNSPTVGGNATAAGTIGGVTVQGTSYPNTASPPPPTQTFPQITYVQSDWQNAGYTNFQTFSGIGACLNAQNYITQAGGPPANTVVRITNVTGGCTLTFLNNTNVTVNGNLAIITDYGITMENTNNWNASGTTKNLYFISTWPSNGCPLLTASKTISTSNNTRMNSFVQAFFYSPCLVSMANSSNWYGQVIGGTVSIANNFNMTFRPVLVPGVGVVTSFEEDIAYVREVAN